MFFFKMKDFLVNQQKKIMREQNIKTGNYKEHIDLIASTIILQSFLDKGVINE